MWKGDCTFYVGTISWQVEGRQEALRDGGQRLRVPAGPGASCGAGLVSKLSLLCGPKKWVSYCYCYGNHP